MSMPARTIPAAVIAFSLCVLHGGAVADDAVQPDGHDYAVVHAFGDRPDGAAPLGGVLALPDGSLLGVTPEGGVHGSESGSGTVFRIAPDGTETVTHNFKVVVDGSKPTHRLTLGSDGRVYGVAPEGGHTSAGAHDGTAFRMDQDGSHFIVLHEFGRVEEGIDTPNSRLIEATDGNFYGTARGGRSGVIYRLTPTGEVTIVHRLDFKARRGRDPNVVIQAANGHLYGTTASGGDHDFGVFFRLRLDGTYRILHHFDVADGQYPAGDIVEAPDGSFYGTTQSGGAHGGGTVYHIKPNGKFFVVHAFGADPRGGLQPYGLVRMADGTLFGTTLHTEAGDDQGTVYKINAAGRLTTLRQFVRPLGGRTPQNDALTPGPDGYLYGTCQLGGADKQGTVFRILPGKADD
jgi:uncharacterized repeat protein (TIGR03803 family)